MMTPNTEAELAETIAAARDPLAIQGGGTRGVPLSGTVLSTRGLSGITLYEPGALTMVARAGTPVADIQAALAAENQHLAFEPADYRPLLGTDGAPTIGGVFAANVSGPRRIQAGAARDFLLGLRFVDGRGDVLKNGGRVMKNVTGYDLVKLMSGAFGTLGVLSEVSFKVLPKPETTATVAVQNLSDAEAVRAMSKALNTPFDVTGVAHVPKGAESAPHTLIRLEGFADSVAYRASALATALAEFGAVHIEDRPEVAQTLWSNVRDARALADGEGDLWRISVKPSDAPGLVARLPQAQVILDWGGGLIWARVPQGTDVRSLLQPVGGHATRVQGQGAVHDPAIFQPQPRPLAQVGAKLRAEFDPKGILNPGLMDQGTKSEH